MSTVVIVPGICGSELLLTGIPVLAGHPLWISPALLASPLWRLLGLAPDGVSPQLPGQPPLAPGPCLPYAYLGLMQHLSRAGYHVACPHFDWRETQARCAQRLADTIRDLATAAPVHLVCHSRGGLIARRALALLQGTGELQLVGRIVGLGVPHYGSYAPAGVFGGWDQFAHFLSLVIGGLTALLASPLLVSNILDVAATWPAMYELLPRPGAPNTTAESINAMYDPVRWSSIRQSVSPAWLAAARASWGTLPALPAGVQWLNVCGVGQPTAFAVADVTLLPRREGIAWTLDGDGTVPQVWARDVGSPVQILNCTHAALVEAPDALAMVTGFLPA